MLTVKVRFSNGVLGPLGVLELEAGQEVTLPLDNRPPPCRVRRGTRAKSGAWKVTYDLGKLKRDVNAARLARNRPCAGRDTVPLISCELGS